MTPARPGTTIAADTIDPKGLYPLAAVCRLFAGRGGRCLSRQALARRCERHRVPVEREPATAQRFLRGSSVLAILSLYYPAAGPTAASLADRQKRVAAARRVIEAVRLRHAAAR